MKRTALIAIVFLFSLGIQAQNYRISFTASGAAGYVNSVFVHNLTKGTKLVVAGNETLHLVWNVGVDELKNEVSIKAYPNPFSGSTNIIISSEVSVSTEIQVFDILGNAVVCSNIWMNQGDNSVTVAGLSSGLYYLSLKSDNLHVGAKLISIGSEKGNPEIYQASMHDNLGKQRKDAKNLVQMHYNSGERILLQGVSGQYSRILTLVPTQDQIVDFEFIACTDADSNHYPVVTIGNMTWMAENLKTTKFRDGTSIPLKTTTWNNDTTPAYCWYNNDQPTFGSIYGALYNWYAVNTGNLCPAGWHIATITEWSHLTYFLYGESIAGGMLKATDTTHWKSPNAGATNETGFSALPGAFRDQSGGFGGIGIFGGWWTATESSSTTIYVRDIYFNSGQLHSNTSIKGDGNSVRCIKD